MKSIVVVTEYAGEEAIYVDGVFRESDSTIYACDIADAAGDEPVTIKHHTAEFEENEQRVSWLVKSGDRTIAQDRPGTSDSFWGLALRFSDSCQGF